MNQCHVLSSSWNDLSVILLVGMQHQPNMLRTGWHYTAYQAVTGLMVFSHKFQSEGGKIDWFENDGAVAYCRNCWDVEERAAVRCYCDLGLMWLRHSGPVHSVVLYLFDLCQMTTVAWCESVHSSHTLFWWNTHESPEVNERKSSLTISIFERFSPPIESSAWGIIDAFFSARLRRNCLLSCTWILTGWHKTFHAHSLPWSLRYLTSLKDDCKNIPSAMCFIMCSSNGMTFLIFPCTCATKCTCVDECVYGTGD